MKPSAVVPSGADLQPRIESLLQQLRLGQQDLALWQGGELAVTAVPGAGKSTGLTAAAAIAIARHQLRPGRQLAIVTLTRSAAANLRQKIRDWLQHLDVPPGGFTVQTIHGLALQIARQNPDAAGLDLDALSLAQPQRQSGLLRQAIDRWITNHPQHYQRLLNGQTFTGEDGELLRRDQSLRLELLPELAQTVIREAKSSGLNARALADLAATLAQDDYATVSIAAGLYGHYQDVLLEQGLFDYDDMLLAALRALEDPQSRHSWQTRIFAVFEDEAQDSSPLQAELLEVLATDPVQPGQRRLLRVGDSNQAINSTFTPADPLFFRRFCQHCQTQQQLVVMDQGGRSTRQVIAAANFLLEWVNRSVGDRLQRRWGEAGLPFRVQPIRPVDPGDPQTDANPPPLGQGLELHVTASLAETLSRLQHRLRELLQADPQIRVALLVRNHLQAGFLETQLAQLGEQLAIPVLNTARPAHSSPVPGELLTLLQFLLRPHSPQHLLSALQLALGRDRIPAQDVTLLATQPERFLYPTPLDPRGGSPTAAARRFCQGLLRARRSLPTTELLTFLALSLDYSAPDLATADKLGDRLGRQLGSFPSLERLVQLLSDLVADEAFEAVDLDNADQRLTRAGQMTLLTMHKAKGLDWDVVFIPFLEQSSFLGQTRNQPVSASLQFLADYPLPQVARSQLRQAIHATTKRSLTPLEAVEEAQDLKLAEEYRLLYVAMTRARKLLWMAAARQAPSSWKTPTILKAQDPTPAFSALLQQFAPSP
jgi:DNA helicase II / ATP-dependent DNA helicase PcrA